MNLIQNLVIVNNLNDKKVTLTWNADTDISVANYYIYRSPLSYGSFVKIASVSSSVLTYQDTLPLSPYMQYFYYVASFNGSVGPIPLFGETYLDYTAWSSNPFTTSSLEYFNPDDMNYFFTEIRKRNLALLQQDGQPFKLMKYRYEGTPCPLCTSESGGQCAFPLGKPIGTNACYNSGFVGGYYPALDILIRVGLLSTQMNLQNEGFRISNKPKFWSLWYPNFNTGDMLVETDNNRRWVIINTQTPSIRGIKTHTDIEVELLSASDMRMRVPV